MKYLKKKKAPPDPAIAMRVGPPSNETARPAQVRSGSWMGFIGGTEGQWSVSATVYPALVSQDEEVDQFFDQSRRRLREATDRLRDSLDQYLREILAMGGGTSDIVRLFKLNEEFRRSAAGWDDAVFDHTGTSMLGLELAGEDEGEENDELDLAAVVPIGTAVSVISRWDLLVTDAAELVRAGRAAHQRLEPGETEADAIAAIPADGVGQALYALVHEYGDPWFEMPGVEVEEGRRDYVARDDAASALEADDRTLSVPQGERLYGEYW